MLRPTFLGFETAKRALNISQSGLDTVGHNIANAQTPGYTRQRVDQVSISSGGYSMKYQLRGGSSQFSGQGALAVGVSQIRDQFLDTRYRNEAASYGQYAVTSSGLTDLENILDETAVNGVSYQLGEFLTELTKQMTSASSAEIATVMRTSASQLVQVLNKTASELKEVMTQQKSDLETAVNTDVNVLLEQIANLNKVIREDNIYGNPSLELNDQRNLLIDQLAEYLPIKVVNAPEKITDDLTISNLSIVLMDYGTNPATEIKLVDKNHFTPLAYRDNTLQNPPGEGVSILVNNNGATVDLTRTLNGGAIRGYLDVINGQGDYAGAFDNTFRGVPYYQKQLDTFARTFADLMNRMNSILPGDFDPATNDLVSVYLDKNLFTNSETGAGKGITASNIQLSEMWRNEVEYFTCSKENPSLPQLVTDENGSPKYDPITNEPVYKTTAKTDNLARISEALQGSLSITALDNNDNSVHLYNGSLAQFWGSVQGDLGLDQKLATSQLESSSTIIYGFADQRDAISAVSVDEEGIKMLEYQNYYNAAARYMTTLDEALGTIIQGMGVVGR